MAKKRATKKTTKGTGLETNVAGLLCYVLGWVSGLVFLVLEKKDKFVRFHAIQSIVVFGAFNVVFLILWAFAHIPWIGIVFLVLYCILGLFALILWLVLMYKAYQGEKFKLPIAGDIAAKNA